MGKASNQKKRRRQGIGPSRADLETQRAMEQFVRTARKLPGVFEARREHRAAVSRIWWRGAEPEVAEVPSWPQDSAGDRFFGDSLMREYAAAPRLATAEIPAAEDFAADSGHWRVAVSALIRAVVLDRVPVTDPLVMKVIELLGPAVDAEVEYADWWVRESRLIGAEEPEFPETDGPILLLGASCLVDATWAILGSDLLRDVLDYLIPRLEDAVAELTCTPIPSGKELGEALIRAAASHFRFEDEPANVQTMQQLGGKTVGNSLEFLTSEKLIQPRDTLVIGLTMLATLADLCRTSEESVCVETAATTGVGG